MTINSRTRTAILVAVPLVALLALILFGYQREANRREQYFTRRNLRVLAVLAQQTESGIEAMQGALASAVNAATARQKVFLDLQTSSLVPDFGDHADTAFECKFDRAVKDKLDLVPGIRPVTGRGCTGGPCLVTGPRRSRVPQTSLAERSRALHQEVEDSEPNDSELILCHPKAVDQIERAIQYGRCLGSLDAPDVCVAFDLSFLLESRIAGGPLDGLKIFVADQTGRVLYQRGSAALNIISLPGEPGAKSGEQRKDAASGAKDDKPTKDGEGVTASPRGLPAIGDLQHMTVIEPVSVDGMAFTLLSQPLRISPSAASGDVVWVVGVLAPQGDVNAQASVSFAATAAIPLIILLGLMATPLLKWATLGTREGLSRWTIVGMAGGLIGGTALVTVLGLGWYAYGGLTADADAELGRFAASLQRNVAEELRAIDATLTSFVNERQAAARESDQTLGGYALCTRVLAGKHCNAEEQAPPQKIDTLQRELINYPHFEMLVLTDADGWQREKWSTRPTTTPMISMANMSSFRDARDDRGIDLPDDGHSSASELALNVTISPNTGETLVVASRVITDGDRRFGRRRGVAMLVSHMVSLVGPVVPPDSGFAVVENDGRVLFHSTAGRRLYETFYAEAQDDNALRAAINARHAAKVDLTYHGRAVRAVVQPLAGTPWSLIVYRDKEILRTLSLEAAATAGLNFAALLLLGALGAGLLGLLLGSGLLGLLLGAAARIPWPDPRRAPRYAVAVSVLAVLAVWLGWALHAFSSADRLVALLLVPPLALVLTALNVMGVTDLSRRRRWALVAAALLLAGGAAAVSAFNGGEPLALVVLGTLLQAAATRLPDHGPRRPWYLSAYVAMTALLLLTVAILPAVGLIGDAVELSAERHNRRRQLALADALEGHAAELRQRYGPIEGRDVLFQSLIARGWDVPAIAALTLPTTTPMPTATAAQGVPTPTSTAAQRGLVEWMVHSLLRDSCASAGCTVGTPHAASNADPAADLCALSLRHFSAPAQQLLPIYSQEALEVRYAGFESASDCTWSIPTGREGHTAAFAVPDPRWEGNPSTAGSPAMLALAPPFYHLGLPTNGTYLLGLLLFAAIVTGVALSLLFLLVSRLFGLPEPEPTPLAQDIEAGRGVILVRSSLGDPAGPGFRSVDLCDLDDPAALPATTCDFGEHLIVRHLERCLEPAWGEAGLTWLEDLARRRAPALTLETDRDVSDYLEEPASTEPAPTPGPAGRRSERWAHLLARFALQPAAKPAAPAPADAGGWQSDLENECRWTPRLRGIAADMRSADQAPAGGSEAVIAAVGERAEAYYRSIWCGLTDEERLVLNHLARHGFVSPSSWRIVRRLSERGLVRRDPALRLMNESFARFVARAEDRATLKGWQHAAGTTAWEWVRNGFAAAVVVAAIVMYLTRPDSLSTWVTFVTAIATLGAKATDVLGFFQVPRRDAKA